MKPLTQKLLIAGAVVLLTATIVLVWRVVAIRMSTPMSYKQLVYYYNPTAGRLEGEQRNLPLSDDPAAAARAVIAALSDAPRNTSLVKTMPEGEDFFVDCSLHGSVLFTWFSEQYHEMQPLEEAIFRASFIWTLTEIPEITQVRIWVDGEELMNSRGNAVGAGNRVNVDINPRVSPERISTRTFTLYFLNETADGLVTEERTVDKVNSDQIEAFIVQLLIDGPTIEGHQSLIPAETKIREAKTEENICYVNLSSDFNSKFTNPALAKLMIYSIVNTLTENLKVKRVQFLIESELWEQFQGLTEFNRLFEKDTAFYAGQGS